MNIRSNKLIKLASIAAVSGMLVGCSDASAKLSDSSTAIFSVGNTTVTKGNMFTTMETMSGADTAINDATSTISSLEVEVTDEIKSQAEDTLSTYKSMYGDTFRNRLEEQGMSEEDYINDYIIPSLLAEQLNYKYVEENWAEVIDLYKPVKATILEFTSQDDANAAIEELNAGSKDAATAASDHNSSSTGTSEIYTNQSTDLDSMIRAVLSSLTTEDGWTYATGSDGATYYALHIDENDPENFRDEATETLVALSNVQNDAQTYYFRKYNFHIYDITIYNGVANSYPDCLVQDMPEETAEAETTAEAE